VRYAYTPSVTLGHLYCGTLTLATLEEPWIASPFGPGGQRRQEQRHLVVKQESCAPDGAYQLRPHSSARHTNVWALHNPQLGVWHHSVPPGLPYGRTAMLIHSGNTLADTEGCVLVGLRHGQGEGAEVLESRRAIHALRVALGPSITHSLLIRPINGTAEGPHVPT
jgi:hypothetical protein